MTTLHVAHPRDDQMRMLVFLSEVKFRFAASAITVLWQIDPASGKEIANRAWNLT
jgi:hypothetical protein